MGAPTVSVIICAYSDGRRAQLCTAIESVLGQTVQPAEILAVIDHNEGLRKDMAASYPMVKVIANSHRRGLSGARNSGLEAARGDIVAFLDDDAIASPTWIENILVHYADESVIGTGGHVAPVWPGRRPPWLPEEFDWVVGCSYVGQPEQVAVIRNPIGCNMSVRRGVYCLIGGFREGMGRTGNDAGGCEETEFFIRAAQALPDGKVLFDPAVSVQHQISPERARWSYFFRRCIAEGRSKTMMVNRVGRSSGLSSERSYVTKVLPLGILRELRDAVVQRNPWGLAKAGSILAGLGFTALGYASARWLAPGR